MQLQETEGDLPFHVMWYISTEYSRRLDESYKVASSKAKEAPETISEHIQSQIDFEAYKEVDEQMADAFLSAPKTSMKNRTFIIPGDGPEDTMSFQVSGDDWTSRKPVWKLFYNGSSVPDRIRMDKDGLKILLVDSIAYKD
ncbi:hypothetical protein SCHPADRAFT_994464 [Schizopora paradoxa]|uniref:Uncharacterized protein n=1 Tax=Schizopora paradoxa TaxID=27342 RepID=A0A0H2S084_9AGAM|nr:hypothetical protein SCHPADRAFT_994464 [Schizopora paradoxa]